MEIAKLFMTPDEDLYDKTIEDVFDEEVFDSTFWMYWRSMFAFENWHSALEMKLYFLRFIHHISGLPDFSALKFTRYNQYESLILPMELYLVAHCVDLQFNTEVTNVELAEEAVDPDDIETLQDLIVAAVNEAMRQVDEASSQSMGKLAGGLGGSLGCLGGGFPF